MHDQRRTLPSGIREEKGEGERRVESRRGRGVRRTTRFYLYDYIPMLSSSSFLPFPFLLSPLSRASFFIPYLLFFLFLYIRMSLGIRIYSYIFFRTSIFTLYTVRIFFAFIRLIFYAFLCLHDKQNPSPLTILQLSYLINNLFPSFSLIIFLRIFVFLPFI